MESTLELLKIAQTREPDTSLAEWCRRIGTERTALNVGKARGHLAPLVAGNLARALGEDPKHWIVVAAMEAAPESQAKKALLKSISGSIKKL